MIAIMKRVTVDNHNEDLVAFAQTIDFTQLFEHTKEFAKVDCTFYQPEIITIRGNVHISFMSADIADQTGAFAAILKSCNLSSFSNSVFKDKETGELGYWVQVHMQYEHKGGGSNGMEVTTARYTKKSGWTFRNAGQH